MVRRGHFTREGFLPLKMVFTVKKYMPIGPATMAAVKPRSL
jgi:hypothetical protein